MMTEAMPEEKLETEEDLTVEGLLHAYVADPHNPFVNPHVGEEIEKIFLLAERFPDYFSLEEASDLCSSYIEQTKGLMDKIPKALWSKGLRAKVLIHLEDTSRDCTKCSLCKNTPKNTEILPGLPVFGEGVIDAEVMMVLEGPGNFECRTGVPLTGSMELRVSHCNQCTGFEKCYTEPGQPNVFKRFLNDPMEECEFHPLTEENRLIILKSRLVKHRNNPHTTGQYIDEALGDVGLMRSTPGKWKKTMEKLDPDNIKNLPEFIKANTYITNAVRHRSCSGPRNVDPTKAQIEACNPYLEMTVELVRPKVIVAFGIPALTALDPIVDMSKSKITHLCPESPLVAPLEVATRIHPHVFVSVHPSYMMRQEDMSTHSKWNEKLRLILRTAKAKALEIKTTGK